MTPQGSLTSTVEPDDLAHAPVDDSTVHDSFDTDDAPAFGTTAELLAMKVSTIIDARPAALDLLIAYGFTPLKQRHLRAILAPTVTLAQALGIRSQSAERERALLAELVTLFTGRGAERAAGRGT